MSLTQEELQLAQKLKQSGATNAQVAGYIGKIRMGVTPESLAPQIEERKAQTGFIGETAEDVWQTVTGLTEVAKNTYQKQKTALGASIDGSQSAGLGFAQAAGIGAGGVSAGIGEVFKGGLKVAMSQDSEDALKQTVSDTISPIASSEPVQKLIQKYQSLDDKQKRNADALLGAGAFMLDIGAGGLISKATKTAVKYADDVYAALPRFIEPQGLKTADDVVKAVSKETPTSQALNKAELEAPDLSIQEKWLGIEPSFKKKIQDEPEMMSEYINVVKARNQDLDLPSVYEFAGDKARRAVDDMDKLLNSTGSQIGKTRQKLGSYSLDNDMILAVQDTFSKQLTKLNLKLVEGRVVPVAGKVRTATTAEIKNLQDLMDGINTLKQSPNLTNAIDLRNVFDKNINFAKSAREISNALDPVSKAVRKEIADQTAKIIGKTEAGNLQQYSDFMRAYDELKSFTDRNAGGEYLLRVFLSGRGGDASNVIKTVAEYTGRDLSKDAVMMTLVTDLLANNTQKNLFRQEITKAGVDVARILSGDPSGFISVAAEVAKKKILDPEKILRKASGNN
jgi:hypothetical protein